QHGLKCRLKRVQNPKTGISSGANGEAGGIRAAWKRPVQGLFASLTV
ncbi:hypothetical protein NM65012_2187, partial [Neisseria meningitidis 65012]